MKFKKLYHTWSDFHFSGSQGSHKRTEGLLNNVYEHIPYFKYTGVTAISETTSY